jgi:hypothetical protein
MRLRGAAGDHEAETGSRGEGDEARHGSFVLSISGGHQKLKPG